MYEEEGPVEEEAIVFVELEKKKKKEEVDELDLEVAMTLREDYKNVWMLC